VAHVETVEILDEFFDKTFIRHLVFGAEETRGKMGGFTRSTNDIPFTGSRVLDTRVTGVFTCTER